MTLAEFVDYCITIAAQTGQEPLTSPILDSQRVIEVLFPAVMREAVRRAMRDPHRRHRLVSSTNLTFNAGSSPLPAGAEEEFASTFDLVIAGDLWSYVPEFLDFSRSGEDLTTAIFTLRGGNIQVFKFGGVPNGTVMAFVGVLVPQVPTLATDPIVASEDLLDDCLIITAAVLKGEIALPGVSAELLKKSA
jgi:hypothetical protein